MNRNRRLLALSLLCTFPGVSHGYQTTWTGGAGNLLWSDPGNWSDGVPEAGQHVGMGGDGQHTPHSTVKPEFRKG